MRIELKPFDGEHYASGITLQSNILKWDSNGGTHLLIIRSEYGKKTEFTDRDKEEIEALPTDVILSENEQKYSDNKFLTFFNLKKRIVNNFTITVRPASYAVYCCEYDPEKDICVLYQPNDACSYYCNVKMKVKANIQKLHIKRGFSLFKKNYNDSQYSVTIDDIPGYVEGSLNYTFDGCKYQYPITKKMLGRTFTVFAFNGNRPKVETSENTDNGYEITENRVS